jgi:hypothetical protein
MFIAAAVAAVALFGGGVWAGTAIAHPAPPAPRIAPCVTEDGSGPRPCLWDAKVRGNGKGHSFISVDGNPDGRKVYLPE